MLKRSNLENKSYLVIDDFGDMRSMIRNMLLACGVSDISVAMNGESAITAMEKKRFDVVLCDYNLGSGKDGQQVLEEARLRRLIGLGTVFVMVTAENTLGMVMGAVEYEPDSYLTKPFNKDLLKSRLEKLLAKKKNLAAVDKAVDRKDFTRAIALLDEKLAQNPPNSNELRKLKGEVCLLADEIGKAAAVYESVLSIREMPWARLGLGKTLFLSKRYQEAREVFQGVINENERYTAAYDWLAKTYKCLNQMDAAQDILQKATELSPKAILRQRALGEIALTNKDDQVAESAFASAVRFGRHSVYKHPSIYANLAKVTASNKSGEAGLKIVKEMHKVFGNTAEADFYSAVAESVIQQGMGNDDASRESLQKALSHYDALGQHANSQYTIELAKTYNHIGDSERAVELLHQAVRNNHTDEELLSEVGATMESLGLKDDSAGFIADIRKEIIRLNNTGVELARDGRIDDAIALFEEAAEGMPGNKVVNLNAARVLMMSMERGSVSAEKAGQVRLYLSRVAKIDPNNQTLRSLAEKFLKITG